MSIYYRLGGSFLLFHDLTSKQLLTPLQDCSEFEGTMRTIPSSPGFGRSGGLECVFPEGST